MKLAVKMRPLIKGPLLQDQLEDGLKKIAHAAMNDRASKFGDIMIEWLIIYASSQNLRKCRALLKSPFSKSLVHSAVTKLLDDADAQHKTGYQYLRDDFYVDDDTARAFIKAFF